MVMSKAYYEATRRPSRLLSAEVWAYVVLALVAGVLLTGPLVEGGDRAFETVLLGRLAGGAVLGLGVAVAMLLETVRAGGPRLSRRGSETRPAPALPTRVWIPLAVLAGLAGTALSVPLGSGASPADVLLLGLGLPLVDLTGAFLGMVAGMLVLMPAGLLLRLVR